MTRDGRGAIGVLHVVAAGEVGGAERMLVDLARAEVATEDGRPVRPSVYLFAPDPRLAELFRDHGLEVDEAPRRREGPAADLARNLGAEARERVRRAAFRRGAAVVHLHTYVPPRRARRGPRPALPAHRAPTRAFDDPTCGPSRWASTAPPARWR